MLKARERPGGRDNKSADILFGSQFSVHLWKPKVIADAQTKAQAANGNAGKRVARSKALLLFNGRDCVQVSLAIFRRDVSLLIDKNLGIVNRCVISLRYAADDCDRKLPGGFLQTRDKSVDPRSSVILNYRHRVAGVDHLRRNDQLSASVFGSCTKVENLGEVCVWITEHTRNLSSRNFHGDSGNARWSDCYAAIGLR